MTTLTTTAARTLTEDYATLRTAVGAYRVQAPLVRLTGDERLTLLDRLLAKSADFVEPETVREVLALNADGSPFALLLHFELADESWLLPRTHVTADALRAHFETVGVPAGAHVEVEPEGWGASAFEGPTAWSAATGFLDYDISGLPLHGIAASELPGEPAALAHLARVGTTGEYGYLLLTNAPDTAHEAVLAAVAAQGGAPVGPEALARVQAEAGMGVFGSGFGGLTVNRADLSWLVDWNRIGEFHGSDDLVAPGAGETKLAAVAAPAGAGFTAGTPVTVAGRTVGTVLWQAPSANPEEELLLAVLDSPFGVPGLDLAVRDDQDADRPVRTVTLPRVVARSLTMKIA
ncbi:aminomethyl transferase family protein [Streptomyces cremeus]|uniref:Aminomethyl transferase family protein n=1 Tax=Streptomyces cremeus TaxID=66881 RepID=A0ABV5PLN3_STRCM